MSHPPTFKAELAAQVLAESDVGRDAAVSKKYGISERTIRYWRKRYAEDPEFAAIYRRKKAEMAAQWAIQAGDWLQALALEAIKLAQMPIAENLLEKPCERLHSVAGAFKIIAEAKISWDMLSDDGAGQQDFEIAAAAAAEDPEE